MHTMYQTASEEQEKSDAFTDGAHVLMERTPKVPTPVYHRRTALA